MASNEDLIIKIQADSANAIKGIEALSVEFKQLTDVLKQVGEDSKKTQKAVNDFGAVFVKISAGIHVATAAYEKFHAVVGGSIEAFVEADDGINTLRNTLKLVGEKDVAHSTERLEEFAKKLQQTSIYSDDAALKYLTLAKALGKTDADAEKLVQTSADLATVTGKDLGGAFEALMASLKGESRALAKYFPELKGMSEESFKAGKGVEFVAQKMAGFAKAATSTISGQAAMVKNTFGDLMEEVGKTIAILLNMRDKSGTIDLIKKLIDIVISIQPVVQAARDAVENFFTRVKAGFTAMQEGANTATGAIVALEVAVVALGVTSAYVFRGQIVAAISAAWKQIVTLATAVYAMIPAAIAAAVPMAILAAKVVLITVAVLALAGSLEFIVNNFEAIAKIGIAVAVELMAAYAEVKKVLIDVFSFENLKKAFKGEPIDVDVTASINKIKGSWDKATANMGDAWKKNTQNLDFGVTGKTFDFMKGFMKDLDGTKDKVDKVTGGVRGAGGAFAEMSKEASAALDSITKKVAELTLKQAELGGNLVTVANMRADAEQKGLDIMHKEAAAKGAITAGFLVLEAQARKLVQDNIALEIYKAQKKALEELANTNRDLSVEVRSLGATQQEVLDMQLMRQLEIISQKEKELGIQGLLNEEAKKGFDLQRSLAKEGTVKKKEAAPTQIQDSLQKGGEVIGKQITDAFGGLMGFTSGVNATVAAAQAVVDAIPQMLDNVTKLLDSITELPIRIMNSFNKLLDAILNLIAKLPENIIKMVTGVIQGLIKFITELPKVLTNLLQQLPAMLLGLLDQLPNMIGQLVQGLVEAGPKISMALIEFLIKDAPKIALKIAEVLAIKLPIAILKGIAEGLKNIVEGVKRLFSGKGFNLVDTEKTVEALKNAIKKVSGSASRLFEVKDLEAAAKAATKGNDVIAQIVNVTKDSVDSIKKIWQWVWDHILEPIYNLVKKAWMWVWDNVLEPILGLVKKAWMWVYEHILEPLGEIVKNAWMWVYDNILEPLANLVYKAWLWVKENILDPLAGYVSSAWQWVIDNILDPLAGAVKTAWQWVVDKILSPLANVVKDAFSWVWENVFVAFTDLFKKMSIDTFGTIGNTLQDVFDFFGDTWDTMMAMFTGKIDLLAGVKKIFSDMFDNGAAIIKDAFDLTKAVLFFAAVWQAMQAAAQLAAATWEAAVQLAGVAWNAVVAAAGLVWQEVVALAGTVWTAVQTTAGAVWATVVDTAGVAWTAVQTTAGAAWTTIVETAGALWGGFVAAAGVVWGQALNATALLFNGIMAVGGAIWSALVIATSTTAGIMLTGGLTVLLAAIVAFFSKDGNIEKTKDFFNNVGAKISDGFKAGVEGLKKGVEEFGKFFKDMFKDAGKLFYDMLGLDKIKKFFTDLNPAGMLDKIFKIPDSAWDKNASNSPIETALGINLPFVKFAKGGKVPGMASVPGDSELNDKIVALLSPGEAIISRTMMNNPAVKAIVDAILSGKIEPPKFSFGGKLLKGDFKGAVNDVKNLDMDQVGEELNRAAEAVKGVVQSLSPDEMWKQVKDKVFSSILKMFESNRFAEGGLVGDTVPAMLTPGEFVMSRSGVANAGLGNLHSINRGGGQAQVVNYNIEVHTTIDNTGTPIDAAFVRQRILPTIENELKRASMEGRFVVSTRGLRNA